MHHCYFFHFAIVYKSEYNYEERWDIFRKEELTSWVNELHCYDWLQIIGYLLQVGEVVARETGPGTILNFTHIFPVWWCHRFTWDPCHLQKNEELINHKLVLANMRMNEVYSTWRKPFILPVCCLLAKRSMGVCIVSLYLRITRVNQDTEGKPHLYLLLLCLALTLYSETVMTNAVLEWVTLLTATLLCCKHISTLPPLLPGTLVAGGNKRETCPDVIGFHIPSFSVKWAFVQYFVCDVTK